MSNVVDEAEDIFKHYGAAVLQAQILEHTIVAALLAEDFAPRELSEFESNERWEKKYQEYLRQHEALTLGQLKKVIEKQLSLSEPLLATLGKALERRNWLVHRLVRERLPLLVNAEEREKLSQELQEDWQLFRDAAYLLHEVIFPALERYGISRETMVGTVENMVNTVLEASNNSLQARRP